MRTGRHGKPSTFKIGHAIILILIGVVLVAGVLYFFGGNDDKDSAKSSSESSSSSTQLTTASESSSASAESSSEPEEENDSSSSASSESSETDESERENETDTTNLSAQEVRSWIDTVLQARAETEEWSFLKEQPYSLSTSTGSDGLVYIEVRQNSEDTMLSSHVTSFRINGKGELEEENQTRTGYEVIASEYGDTGLE